MNKKLMLLFYLAFASANYAKQNFNTEDYAFYEAVLNNHKKSLEAKELSRSLEAKELIIKIMSLLLDIQSYGLTEEVVQRIEALNKEIEEYFNAILQGNIKEQQEDVRLQRKEDYQFWQSVQAKEKEASQTWWLPKQDQTQATKEYPGYLTEQQAKNLEISNPSKYKEVVKQKTDEFNEKLIFDKAFDGY